MTRPLRATFSVEDPAVVAANHAEAISRAEEFRDNMASIGGCIESVPLEDIPLYLAMPDDARMWKELFRCEPAPILISLARTFLEARMQKPEQSVPDIFLSPFTKVQPNAPLPHTSP
jgi:hypothetical protein